MSNLILIASALLFSLMIILDLKYKEMPSILGTGILLILAVVNIQNLPFAVCTFIFGLLLYESTLYSGVADVKLITAVGFLISSIPSLVYAMAGLTLITLFYNVIAREMFKVKGNYAGTVPIFIWFILIWVTGVIV